MQDRFGRLALATDPLRPSAGRAEPEFATSDIPCRRAGAHAAFSAPRSLQRTRLSSGVAALLDQNLGSRHLVRVELAVGSRCRRSVWTSALLPKGTPREIPMKGLRFVAAPASHDSRDLCLVKGGRTGLPC